MVTPVSLLKTNLTQRQATVIVAGLIISKLVCTRNENISPVPFGMICYNLAFRMSDRNYQKNCFHVKNLPGRSAIGHSCGLHYCFPPTVKR